MKSLILLPVIFFGLMTCGCSLPGTPEEGEIDCYDRYLVCQTSAGYGSVINCPDDQKDAIVMFIGVSGFTARIEGGSGQTFQSLYSACKEREDWIEDWSQDHPGMAIGTIPGVSVQYAGLSGFNEYIITDVLDWNPPY